MVFLNLFYQHFRVYICYCNNCYIYENSFNYNRLEGISLYKSNEISIFNNTYYKNMYGMWIHFSRTIKINNCSFYSNYDACKSRDSQCFLSNCQFYDHEVAYHSDNFYTTLQDTINNSLFKGNYIGIELYEANGIIEYNEFNNNIFGCYIVNSTYELNFNLFVDNTEDLNIE